jgi:PKD repeat protein
LVTPVGEVPTEGTEGGNAANHSARTVIIGLTGVSNATEPVPAFTVTPLVPEIRQVVTFNASTTLDEGTPCLDNCTYTWDFDGEGTATGRIVSHAFQTARAFNVSLTVTDAAGVSVTLRQVVVVSAIPAPTVTVTVSPTSPIAGLPATFRATAAAATNHSIVRYNWNWGNGSDNDTTDPVFTRTFDTPGTYVLTVTVFDDTGQRGAVSVSVVVVSGVSANFIAVPSAPSAGQTVNFNASNTTLTGGATVAEYQWDFGDGATETTTAPTTSHSYAAGSYIVRLTVVDSLGRTGTVTQSLTVTP